MQFNFDTVERGMGFGTHSMVNRLRITKKALTLSSDIAQRAIVHRTKYATVDRYKVFIRLAYDPVNQAIRLTEGDPNDHDSFVGAIYEGGAMSMRLPSNFLAMNPILGDYLPVEGQPNVYQLAR